MNAITENIINEPISFAGVSGNKLAAERYSLAGGDPLKQALFLHGGGQTRHSWGGSARALAAKGWTATAMDQRGHGQSEWLGEGGYEMEGFSGDLTAVCNAITAEAGALPVIIGASLGGLAGMVAIGYGMLSNAKALVLVDITPNMRQEGVEKILGFMAERAEAGFETLEEAADAIAAYLPHRERPKDNSGLAKNLRLDADGRYRWHWDPAFLTARRDPKRHRDEIHARLNEAARGLKLPVLLVRGRESELVGEAEAAAFRELVPHAKVSDVSGARHMIAGDRNDVFTEAVLAFLDEV